MFSSTASMSSFPSSPPRRGGGGRAGRRSLSTSSEDEVAEVAKAREEAEFAHEHHRRKSLSLELKKDLMDPVEPLKLFTKMPRWDVHAESLVLGFERNRVLCSSSKNVIMTMPTSKRKHHAVLQFGKSASGIFNLDFRYPMSPIQAFALAVSSFGWSTKNRR